MAVFVGYLDQPLRVPLEQRPLDELLTECVYRYCNFNCAESLEIHRRLLAGEATLGHVLGEGSNWPRDPLELAYRLAKKGQLTLACELIKRVSIGSDDLRPDIYHAALSHGYRIQHDAVFEMFQCLHDRGFMPWSAQNLLSHAACRHGADVVQFIVEKLGADVNKLSWSECPYSSTRADQASPLFHAVYYLNVDVVRYLLSVNADVSLCGPCSQPACIHEPLRMAQELQHFFSTREEPRNPTAVIDLWSHVSNKLEAVASILDMLSTALPHEEDPLA